MGTRNHPLVSNQPFFVTVVTRNRQPIFHDHNAADLMLTELWRLREELRFALLGYVVMVDHIHLILVPGEAASLSQIMQLVKGRFARAWNERRSRTGSLWQSRYYESAVRTQEQLTSWIEYIDRNPLEAGLVASAPEYPYCSAGGRLATDLEAYLDGSWGGQAKAWPSDEKGLMAGRAEAWPSG
ncbi:MAG: transposase [Chloroflexi bacterium]|nr:transposase [Chloroflexota bacterium]